jgi:hypothetical protein
VWTALHFADVGARQFISFAALPARPKIDSRSSGFTYVRMSGYIRPRGHATNHQIAGSEPSASLAQSFAIQQLNSATAGEATPT